jgi:erythromycin esterase-like protein
MVKMVLGILRSKGMSPDFPAVAQVFSLFSKDVTMPRTVNSPGFDVDRAAAFIQEKALPLSNDDSLDPLMDRIGDARVVMLGEASHGTHEYYTWRSRISKRLIREKGFSFIAVEGDWPDCYRLNRYLKGYTQERHASDVLHSFGRWPTWMWANWEVAALAE